MKIIVVHIGDILKYPPVVSLINTLSLLDIKVEVITTQSKFNELSLKNVNFHVIPVNYESINSPVKKLINLFSIKKDVMKAIEQLYDNDSVLWITYNVSLKHINTKKLLSYRYVLQLMELMEELRFHGKLPIKLDKRSIGNNALAVVVPEYNRAHITKVWWELEDLPCILHNKPYYSEKIEKNSYIDDREAREIIESLSDKKIILYQGILTVERPLDALIHAVDKLGDDYALVIMSGGKNIYEDIDSSNYYFIPFIDPPYHLQITSHAYIGILTYIPVKSEFSQLNVLYCAPNKTYEYGMFGIPMLSNNLPGLQLLFEIEKCGTCFDEFTIDSICEAIKRIDSNYGYMSKNALEYYNKTDYKEELVGVLNVVKDKWR